MASVRCMSALNLKACNIFKQDFFNQSVQLGNNLTFYALRALRDLAMKKIIAVMAIGLMMLSMSVSADAARRFGGGMSFGRSASTLQQKAAPAAPNHLNQQKAAPQQQQRQQAAPNQTQRPQPQAASPMRGMLMGLAAALGITALAHALGLGDAFASFVMMALVAIVAFYAIRFLMGFLLGRRVAAPVAGERPERMTGQQPVDNSVFQHSAQSTQNQFKSTVASPMSGSVLDELNNPQSQFKVDVPADFDVESFLKVAEANFAKMQRAWDTGDLSVLSDFTSDEVFRTVSHQLHDRGQQDYQTEIVTLKSDFRGIVRDGDEYLAGVHFDGTLNVSGEAERVDETWILSKPVHGNGGWLLSGIHQDNQ